MGRLEAADHAALAQPEGARRQMGSLLPLSAAAAVALVAAALFPGLTAAGWRIALPGDLALELRWPRAVAVLAAGADMAVSGVILQRLLWNPLASPDIVGISSGASLALVAALVTAFVGPVAFVGLVAPHMASLLGARRAAGRPALALLIGTCLFVAADWIGRTALYPRQLPAGAMASILGGAYLAGLLARRRAVAT